MVSGEQRTQLLWQRMDEAVESCERVAEVTQNEGERVLVRRAEGTVGKLRGDGDEAASVGRDRANHAPGQGGRARAGKSSGHEDRGFHQHALMALGNYLLQPSFLVVRGVTSVAR